MLKYVIIQIDLLQYKPLIMLLFAREENDCFMRITVITENKIFCKGVDIIAT